MTPAGTKQALSDRHWQDYAERIGFLARFHDREPDGAFLEGLCTHGIGSWMAAAFHSPAAKIALSRLGDALDRIPFPVDGELADAMAVDYAEIYLTFAHRISANGSVWLTDDSLERQEPMFAVRQWYQRYGIDVPNWRDRADDHIVHQLQFLAYLLNAGSEECRADAARFLDVSLMQWIGDFARAMRERVHNGYFVAAAELTLAALEEIRDALAQDTGIARPSREPDGDAAATAPQAPGAYFPGVGEGW